MKKILLIGLLAGGLTACNNASESTENKIDSIDSAASEQKEMIDSTAEQKMERVDSTAEVKKENLERKDSLNQEVKKDASE